MQEKQILIFALILSVLATVSCVANTNLSSYSSFPNATGLSPTALRPQIAFNGDYFLIYDTPYQSASKVTANIFKYDKLSAELSFVADYVCSPLYFLPSTNGNWFGNYNVNTRNIDLLQLSSLNATNITTTPIDASQSLYGFRIMPDDSIVVVFNNGVNTYIYNGTQFALVDRLETLVYGGPPYNLFDLTDTHYLNWNTSGGFQIYARNQQLGWDLIESGTGNPIYPSIASLIDTETIMVRSPFASDPRNSSGPADGFLTIISKVNGTWTEQIILAEDLQSVAPTSSLGFNAVVLNSDNVLIGVPNEGYSLTASKRSVQLATTPGNYGAAYLIQRGSNGAWRSNGKFIRTGTQGYLGSAMGAIDDKAFIVACDFYDSAYGVYNCYPYYSFKTCTTAPINVTCNNSIVLNDCSDVDLSKLELYSQHDADCGAVTVEYSNVRVKDNKIVTTFSFTRPLAPAPVTCDVSVTCPVLFAPVAPVSVSVPVSTPTKKVSGVAQLTVSVGVALSIASLLL